MTDADPLRPIRRWCTTLDASWRRITLIRHSDRVVGRILTARPSSVSQIQSPALAGTPAKSAPKLRAGLLWIGAFVFGALTGAAQNDDIAGRTLLLDATLSGETVLVVGERGTILRSTDHARSWVAVHSSGTAALTGVTFARGARGWAVGHDGLILTTNDAGQTWTKQWQSENLTDSFLDVLAIDERHALAVGGYGLYVETHDGGQTWIRRKIIDDDFHFNRVSRGSDGALYLAGERGTLLRSTDAGARWSPRPADYDGSFYGIIPLGERRLLAHGLRGRIFISDNAGETWAARESNAAGLLATAIRLSSGATLVAGQARAVLVSANDGETWTRSDVALTHGIAELLELRDGAVLAVGEAGATRLELNRLLSSKP